MHYKNHIFFCTNQKAPGKPCCADGEANAMCEYTKEKLQALDLWGPGKVRVSSSGCLGRCKQGPNILVYPEGVWYRYTSKDDIDAIITSHLINGEIVEKLLVEDA